MKNIPTFEDFINESREFTTVKLSAKAASSFEKELKGNNIKYTKIRPTVFQVELGPKANMAIKMTKERFGSSEIIVEEAQNGSVKNEPINEDVTTAILMLQAAMVGGQIALLANKVDFHPIEDLKDWWREHKRDKAVQSILDKLKDDQDVIEFLQLPKSKQEGQWKKLIAPKLNADELKYINSISRDRVKTGKI